MIDQELPSQDHMKACHQPAALVTLLTMIIILPMKMVAIFTLFIKIEKLFNLLRFTDRNNFNLENRSKFNRNFEFCLMFSPSILFHLQI